jgi:hypothetical protein
VRFDDSDVLTWTAADLSDAAEGVSIEKTTAEELQITFGNAPLAAGESTTWTIGMASDVTLKADSFFDAQVRLTPARESDASNAPNTADYHYRLKFNDQLVGEKYEKTGDLNWKRTWRVDLSEWAGKTGTFSFEVEVQAGPEHAQEGFPVVRGPSIEGVEPR